MSAHFCNINFEKLPLQRTVLGLIHVHVISNSHTVHVYNVVLFNSYSTLAHTTIKNTPSASIVTQILVQVTVRLTDLLFFAM